MPLIQFPDVKVEIKGPGSRNPFFVGALGVPLGGASEPLARAFAQDIEGTGLFYGATIDVIGNGIRGRDAWAHFDDIKLMDELISEFADPRNGLVYAVAIDNNAEGGAPLEKNKPYKAEKVLTTKKEMLDFWGSDEHREKLKSICVDKECGRCTYGEYARQIEELVMGTKEEDPMCVDFP